MGNMKKVAILDDELISRNRANVAMENIENLNVVISTADPYEIFNYIKTKRLDLIILDMNMPQMNGLEFLKELSVIDDQIHVLVMSGYTDFDYATGSMHYGAIDYIVKHDLSRETILRSLNRVKFFEDQEQNPNIKQITDSDKLALFSTNNDDPMGVLKSILPSFVPERMRGMVIKPINIKDKVWDKVKYRKRVLKVLTEILDDALSDRIMRVTVISSDGELYGLLSFAKFHSIHEVDSFTRNLNEKLSEAAYRLMNVRLFIVVTEISNDLMKSLTPFYHKEHWQTTLFYAKDNNGTNLFNRESLSHNTKNLDVIDHLLLELNFLVTYFQKQQILLQIRKIFQYCWKERLPKKVVTDTVNDIERQLSQMVNSSEEGAEQVGNYYQRFDTFMDLKVYFNEICEIFLEDQERRNQKTYDELVVAVIAYIHQHFQDNISLKSCANDLHVNYSYLSRIFNQQYHCSFSQYLNEVRVAWAKILLLEGKDSIADIVLKSGYVNYNYFFRVFKEVTGTSPSNYVNSFKTSKKKRVKVK